MNCEPLRNNNNLVFSHGCCIVFQKWGNKQHVRMFVCGMLCYVFNDLNLLLIIVSDHRVHSIDFKCSRLIKIWYNNFAHKRFFLRWLFVLNENGFGRAIEWTCFLYIIRKQKYHKTTEAFEKKSIFLEEKYFFKENILSPLMSWRSHPWKANFLK